MLSDDAKAAKEKLKTFEGRSLHIQYSRPKNSKKKKQKEKTTGNTDDDISEDETSPAKNDDDQSGNLFKTFFFFCFINFYLFKTINMLSLSLLRIFER